MQFPIISKSQDEYIPLAVENAQWIVAMGDMTSIFPVESLWEYYATGDTTINAIVYKKVFRRSLVTTQDPPPFTPNSEYQLHGFIRDDTLERKVYAIDLYGSGEDFCPANTEFLMYDFSVDTGDSVVMCLLPDWGGTYFVDTTLSLNFFGMDTRVFYINWEECYEGIGSYYGLFEPMFMALDKVSSNPIYYTYLYYYCRQAPCGLIVSLPEEENLESSLHLYPNPARNTLSLSFPNIETGGEIRVFNIQGQELRRILIKGEQLKYHLDISGLSMGSYFLFMINHDNVIAKEKFFVIR